MQEFFITPAMMSPAAWDAIAEAVGFAQRNADILVDTHGIGGDPAKSEPYGYAAWSPRGGVLTLRNPSDQPVRLVIDLRTAFDLPPGTPQRYKLRSPWKESADRPALTLQAGCSHAFELAPFEVQICEANPL